jgi:large subunit ribosomal protein L22
MKEEKKQAKAIGRNLKTSPYKLNQIAKMIRGKKVELALNDLRFAPQKMARAVYKVLNSAIANAENNYNLNIDELIVAEACVGKGLVLKRWRPRARGRTAAILKPFSEITVIVEEKAGEK